MIAVSNSFDLLSFAKYLPVHLLIYFEILGVKEGFPVFQGTFDRKNRWLALLSPLNRDIDGIENCQCSSVPRYIGTIDQIPRFSQGLPSRRLPIPEKQSLEDKLPVSGSVSNN